MGHRKAGNAENEKDLRYFHNRGKSIIASDAASHGRMRRILSHVFSAQGMLAQEPLIRGYVELQFERLKEESHNGATPLDLVKWYNWTTFDIIGDLAFGEPFRCLETSSYHSWVAIIFEGIKQMTILTQIRRLWAQIDSIIDHGAFQRLYAKSQESIELTNERVAKRMELGSSRPDFMSAMISKDDSDNHVILPSLRPHFGK